MRFINKLLSVLQLFKTKEDPLVDVLMKIGFRKRGFFSLMLSSQFRKVLKATGYKSEFIAVLSQFGDTPAKLGVTAYVRESDTPGFEYSLFLVPSSEERPDCMFKQSPELLIAQDFKPDDVSTIVLSHVASFVCLYKAHEFSKSRYVQAFDRAEVATSGKVSWGD